MAQETTLVEFLKPQMRYQPGDVAGILPMDAEFYISKHIAKAVDVEAVKRAKAQRLAKRFPGGLNHLYQDCGMHLDGGEEFIKTADAPKRRGRPPGSKNKPAVEAPATADPEKD